MKEFKIHGESWTISGETLKDAVKDSLGKLKWIRQRSASEAEITGARIRYESGILGGKGGVEVTIEKMVKNYTNRPAEPEVTRVWIPANKEDCPEEIKIV